MFIIDDVIENQNIAKFYFFETKLTFVNIIFLHKIESNLHGYMRVLRIYGHMNCSFLVHFKGKYVQILASIFFNMHFDRNM